MKQTRKPARPKPARKTRKPARPAPRLVVDTLASLPARHWAAEPAPCTTLFGATHATRVWSGDVPGYVAWWHEALTALDAAEIAALRSVVNQNNAEVAAVASNLDLSVKSYRATEAKDEIHVGAHVVQFDAYAMARRIEAAAARHKVKGTNPRGHKSANRWLRYRCPSCERTIRAAGATRVILCAGTHEAPHDPQVAAFEVESLPEYRADDQRALAAQEAGEDVAPFVGAANYGRSVSLTQLAAAANKPAKPAPVVNPSRDEEIPF